MRMHVMNNYDETNLDAKLKFILMFNDLCRKLSGDNGFV